MGIRSMGKSITPRRNNHGSETDRETLIRERHQNWWADRDATLSVESAVGTHTKIFSMDIKKEKVSRLLC